MILETLIVPLLADTDKYISGLTKAEKETEKSTKSMSDKFKGFGDGAMKVGGILDIGVTAPLMALGNEAKNAASDLNETISKTTVVFGKNAEEVLKFGDNSAQALGMSKNAALSAASTYGNLFVSMGMTTDKSKDLSLGIVGISSDLASFNNLDPTDVLQKFQSGLTGETEPLKSLGININQAMIEEKAMELGLWDGVGAIDASSKAQAVYALAMEQTKTAQGDFARTSDGLANSTRIQNAEFENAKAAMGESLLPIMTELTKTTTGLITSFNELSPSTKQNIVTALALLAALGPVISIVGGVSSAVGSLIGIWGSLGAVGTFLSGTVLPAVGTAIGVIGLPVIALGAALGLLGFVIYKFGGDAWNTLSMLSTLWRTIFINHLKANVDTLVNSIGAIGNAIQGVLGWIGSLGSKLSSLTIPDFLTMHSPPKLAQALAMIQDEMKDLSRSVIPEFATELNVSGVISPSVQNIQPIATQPKQQDIKVEIDYNRLAIAMRDAVQLAVA